MQTSVTCPNSPAFLRVTVSCVLPGITGTGFSHCLLEVKTNCQISSLLSSLCSPDYPCLAEYSDGVYYRATITKITSVEPVMIMVHHVDFGSDDTLPTSKYELYTTGVQVELNWVYISMNLNANKKVE